MLAITDIILYKQDLRVLFLWPCFYNNYILKCHFPIINIEIMNRLARETSPYLLQHAHNPVDWYPWGEEALQKAKTEGKPILVSIGYAACHWCHVMERESFEDQQVAELMNTEFVNIKIDREERPDLDHIYMDAVQAIAGQGGWPLNVFLTPDLKPFYGGTYFPPQRAFNRSSWTEVLLAISDAFKNRRTEIESQANNLTEHLNTANNFGITSGDTDGVDIAFADAAFHSIMKSADQQEGGFGNAPKFPQSFTIRFLLHHHYYTGQQHALDQAMLSLNKMAMGGIYDQLGGGFARYSTDAEWLAPHFEKMLYDNALLIVTYSEAYQLTANEYFREIVYDTLSFIEREMLSLENGFYSALDADSEGVEGKYYVWSKDEIDAALGVDAAVFSDLFDVTQDGNWEHSNILRLITSYREFAARQGMDEQELIIKVRDWKNKLMALRDGRIRPLLDDKVLLGWNALMNSAYTRAYAAFGDERFLEMAMRNMSFLLNTFITSEGNFHTYKEGVAKYPAFLDDLAFLVQALIDLHEVSGELEYLYRAKQLTEQIIEEFSEADSGYFYFTARGQSDVIVRKKEIYDGAVPSGNSTMAQNLYQLGMLFDKRNWIDRSHKMLASLANVVKKYPTSFGLWATFGQALAFGIPEIAIVGELNREMRKELLRTFIPMKVLQSSLDENSEFPLLAGKPATGETRIYLCRNYACSRPVTQAEEVIEQLKNAQNFS